MTSNENTIYTVEIVSKSELLEVGKINITRTRRQSPASWSLPYDSVIDAESMALNKKEFVERWKN